MNRTLAGILEIASVSRTSILEHHVALQKQVTSGSEVFTHPTENVQKPKSFISQVKIIEKFTFMKIQQICYFSKEKLLFSKIIFTELTHRVRFSTRPVTSKYPMGLDYWFWAN